jgi:hypothetical protein
MLRWTRAARPTAAMVIAILALVAGVSGVVVAGPIAKKAVTAEKARKIADREITKLASGLSVANADNANNAANAANAAKLGGFSAGELGGGIMLGSITDMNNGSLPSNVMPLGITEGSGGGGGLGAPAPVDIEVSDLRINAPLFDPGDSVTFAIASAGAPTAVSCTATVDQTTCDSGPATATIPAGKFVTVRYAGGGIHDRNLAFFGWRYRTLP